MGMLNPDAVDGLVVLEIAKIMPSKKKRYDLHMDEPTIDNEGQTARNAA